MTEQDVLTACERLFLFPLGTTVLFPNTVLPLHVFEPRYRALTRDCLASTQCLAIPLLVAGWERDYEGRPPIHPVAGMAKIVQHEELDDGRFVLVLRGIARVRIEDEIAGDEPYRVARCAPLEIPRIQSATIANRALERLRLHFGQFLVAHEEIVGDRDENGQFVVGQSPEIRRLLEGSTHPVVYCDLIGHLVLSSPEDRQKFLETDSLEERIEQLIAAITLDRGSSVGGAEA
jgi:Lon protease-like protein